MYSHFLLVRLVFAFANRNPDQKKKILHKTYNDRFCCTKTIGNSLVGINKTLFYMEIQCHPLSFLS
ncbi:MAG: hypothetical protein CR997_07835 [Acidobacteria bacterium]|nr:MAG: hypothetical protein CR997_07835 [Acidobacteriota bacterium]